MTRRPPHVKPPAYLNKTVPVPEPEAVPVKPQGVKGDSGGLDPTRYGDWEHKGVAIDF